MRILILRNIKQILTDIANLGDLATNDSLSFKYKSSILKIKPDTVDNDSVLKNAKIDVPLKYLSSLWRSWDIPLINCRIHLELNCTKNCVMSDNGDENNNDEVTFKKWTQYYTFP